MGLISFCSLGCAMILFACAPSQKIYKRLAGFTLLGVVVVIWVASSVILQSIFEDEVAKPVSVTVYSISLSVILLLTPQSLRLLKSRAWQTDLNMPRLIHVTALGLMWLVMEIVYNISLTGTAVSTNTCLSATSSIFTFIFSLFILKNKFRKWSAFGVILTAAGILTTVLAPPSQSKEGYIGDTWWGDSLALLAAVFYGMFYCFMKVWVKDEAYVSLVFGSFGIQAIFFGGPVVALCHFTGLEVVEWPGSRCFAMITANAVVGTVLSDYLLSLAVVLLDPLIACIGLSLTIPISCIADSLILKKHTFSVWFIVGALVVYLAVVIVSIDQRNAEGTEPVELEPAKVQESCTST